MKRIELEREQRVIETYSTVFVEADFIELKEDETIVLENDVSFDELVEMFNGEREVPMCRFINSSGQIEQKLLTEAIQEVMIEYTEVLSPNYSKIDETGTINFFTTREDNFFSKKE